MMKYLIMIISCFLLATGVSLAGVLVLQATGLMGTADTDFKNLPYGIAVGVNLCFALFTLPALLNMNRSIRMTPLWSGLSFFLFPALLVVFLLLAMWDEPWPGALFCLPYIAILTIFYLRFRRNINHNQ